jgi:hypothetical protein
LSALENVYSYLNPTKRLIAKDRLLEHPDVSGTLKSRAREIKKSQDIVCLQESLEKACDGLGRVVSTNCAAFSLGGRNGWNFIWDFSGSMVSFFRETS